MKSTDDHFVVTDAALMEMCKSNTEWEQTLRRSLKHLSSVPSRAHVVLSNGECMTAELSNGMPLTLEAMMSDEKTTWLRNLLVEVAEDRTGPAFELMNANILEANQSAQQQHLNHEANRETLVGLIETFRHTYSAEFLQRLRANGVSEEELVAIVSHAVTEVVNDASMSWPNGTTAALVEARSYTMRWLWLRVEAVTTWLAKGGIENARPDRLTNHEIDNHYVAVASYCDQLLTEDRRAIEKDQRLRTALKLEDPWRVDKKDP